MFFQRILHPTDFSELSRAALHYASELAHDHGARLYILHVVGTLGPENVTYGEAVSQPQPETYRKRLWEEIHQVKPDRPDIPVEYILSELGTTEAILQVTVERKCDLIVMGSHGRAGLKRFFMGSVAEEVIRKAPCPVLVVKADSPPPRTSLDRGTELHPQELTDQEL